MTQWIFREILVLLLLLLIVRFPGKFSPIADEHSGFHSIVSIVLSFPLLLPVSSTQRTKTQTQETLGRTNSFINFRAFQGRQRERESEKEENVQDFSENGRIWEKLCRDEKLLKGERSGRG